jgi:Flp pilus assembly pilin Flp
MFRRLWNDDAGVVTVEYLVLGTFVGLSLIVGVTSMASSVNGELSELAQAIATFNQDYESDGYSHCNAEKEGSEAQGDVPGNEDIVSIEPNGTAINDRVCE